MSDLLPPNSTALERALATVGAAATDLPVLIRELWDPEACPLELLPWLAWAWSVDAWDDAWSERQKRATIKASIEIHRHKGTVGALQDALDALGLEARIIEWFASTPARAPYTFRLSVTTESGLLDQAVQRRLMAVVAAAKNLRSHLEQIQFAARSPCTVHAATVACVGNEIQLGFKGNPVVINALAICLG